MKNSSRIIPRLGLSSGRRTVLLVAAVLAAGVPSSAFAATLTWDSSGSSPASPVDGSGNWDTATALWSNGSVDSGWGAGNTAVFGGSSGTPGVVTIDDASGGVSATGVTFNVNGYTLNASGTDTLALSGTNPILTVTAGNAASITVPVSGAFGTLSGTTISGLGIAGGGTLNFAGTTANTGDTYLRDSSTLNLNGNASIGNAAGSFYLGVIPTSGASDTSVVNMNGNATLTAKTLNIDYNLGAITASTTVGSTLNVNGSNTINANTINVTAGRANSATKGGDGQLRIGAGGTLTLNGAAGAGSAVTLLDIANYAFESGGSTGTGISGVVDFSPGTVNGNITTVNIGTAKGGTGTGTGLANGTLLFSSGVLNLGTVNIARVTVANQPSSGALTLIPGATGTITAGAVNFFPGNAGANTSATTSYTGALTVSGGTLNMTGNIASNSAHVLSTATTAVLSATVTINGGTLNMNNNAIGDASDPINVNAMSGTLQGVSALSGNGGLTKTGAGTLFVAGNNGWTGDTNVNTGTLIVTGALTGGSTVQVNTNGALGGGGDGISTGLAGNVSVNGGGVHPGMTAGDVATLYTSNLTFHTGGLTIDLGTGLTSDKIVDSGVLTLGDSNSSALALTLAGAAPAVGVYEILDYAGTLTKNADFSINGPIGLSYTLDYSTSGKVFLDVAAATNLLTWTGAADQTSWDFSHQNFSNGSAGTAFTNGTAVLFDDTAPANATIITIPANIAPLSVNVNSSSRNYTFQGAGSISGNASLNKDGASTLIILNNNTYTGSTNILNGTLQVGNGGTTGSIGTGTINNNGGLVFNRSDAVTLSNPLTGNGTLTQAGTGTLTISAPNNYTGTTTIANGTLVAAATGALGTGPVVLNPNGTLIINADGAIGTGNFTINGGTFDNTSGGLVTLANNTQAWSGSSTFIGTQSLNMGKGQVTLNGNPAITVNANTLTVAGIIKNGSGNQLTVSGAGTLILTGLNTFTGGTTVNGNLQVTGSGGNSALGAGDVTVNAGGTLIGGGADAFGFAPNAAPHTITINGGTITDLPSSNFRVTLPNLTFTGGTLTSSAFNAGDTGGQYSLLGNATVATITTNPASTTALINAPAISLQMPTNFNVAAGAVSSGPTPGVDLLVSSAVRNFQTTTQSLTKSGAGLMQLAGANTYTGDTKVSAGELDVTSTGALSSGNISVASGATLAVLSGGLINATANLTNNGTATLNIPSITLNTLVGSSSPAVLNLNATQLSIAATGTYAGAIHDNATSATLTVNAPMSVGSFNVGTVNVNANLQIASTSKTGALNLQGSTGAWTTGIDLAGNKFILESTPTSKATALAQLQDQVNFGKTNAAGITSSTLPANTALAVIDNGALLTPLAMFGGVSVDTNSLLVTPELLGDSNIDGHVDLNDLNTVLNHLGAATTNWTDGNFDGAATIDLNDLNAVLNHLGTSYVNNNAVISADALLNSSVSNPVPEPGSLAAITVLLPYLALRKRGAARESNC